jgi:hypothetical protein
MHAYHPLQNYTNVIFSAKIDCTEHRDKDANNRQQAQIMPSAISVPQQVLLEYKHPNIG